MKLVFMCLFFYSATVAEDLTEDPVLLNASEPRFQYLHGPDGCELSDTWVKESDVIKSNKYRPDEEIVYYFFSRANPSFGVPVSLGDNGLLMKTDFSPLRKTAIIVHGWKGNSMRPFNQILVPAFLKAVDCNVIVVDWGAGAQTEYVPALLNTVSSGTSVGLFINWLSRVTSLPCNYIHLVGHGLGGHLVGIAGRNSNCSIDYITALDPSGPLWSMNNHKFRADDGAYTEVIHTNAGEAGYLLPIGQVDIYANDGTTMPGCDDPSCSHDRSWWYFAESLTTNGFKGSECDNYMQAIVNSCKRERSLHLGGVGAKHGSTGIYRVDTNAVQPFSKD